MKGLFGVLALLITVALIGYILLIQLEIFERGASQRASGVDVGFPYTSDPETIIDTIDVADDAARALELRSKVDTQFVQ